MLWAWGGAENCAEQPEVSGGPGWEGRNVGASKFPNLFRMLIMPRLFVSLCPFCATTVFTEGRQVWGGDQGSYRQAEGGGWISWLMASLNQSCWIYSTGFQQRAFASIKCLLWLVMQTWNELLMTDRLPLRLRLVLSSLRDQSPSLRRPLMTLRVWIFSTWFSASHAKYAASLTIYSQRVTVTHRFCVFRLGDAGHTLGPN